MNFTAAHFYMKLDKSTSYASRFLQVIFSIMTCTLIFTGANAQTPVSDKIIMEKLDLYASRYPDNRLFVHTDKTLYTNNETIWFSAYLLKSEEKYAGKNTILSVVLFREDNRELLIRDKYLMRDGLSFGSLTLPDTIPPGNYQLAAFTNLLDQDGLPLIAFTQPLTLKSISQQDFNASLHLLDTVIRNGMVRARLDIRIEDTKSKEKAVLDYNIGQHKKQGIVLQENSYMITVPAEQLNTPDPVLLTSVMYNKQIQYLSLKLPEVARRKIHVRFFPEGGSLSAGLKSRVGWEAATDEGLPVKLTGVLYRDEQAADTISTNSYGIGKFSLKPERGSRYTLKVSANDYLQKDTVYVLPDPIEDGIVIKLAEAVVKDSLQVDLYCRETRQVKILVHNYNKMFGVFTATASPTGSRLKIVLPALPKGIATLTLLDERGRPRAERLFFAHYDKKVSAEIVPDHPQYKRRDSVKVKLKLLDKNGDPVKGLLSVAVVQDNRIEGSKRQDIESYTYLDNWLGDLPLNPSGRGFSDKEYLEDIFLVRGWRRFSWQELMSSTAEDTVVISSPGIAGKVRFRKRPLEQPVSLTVMRDSVFEVIDTGPDGTFTVDEDHFLVNEGRKALVSVNEKNKQPYTIHIQDPYLEAGRSFAESFRIQRKGRAGNVQSTGELSLQGLERSVSLAEVVVNGNKDSGIYGKKGPKGSNRCGDYVDDWGYLNYPPSAGRSTNTQPIPGKQYKIRTDLREGLGTVWFSVRGVTYTGCYTKESPTIFNVPGIYLARDFYGPTKEAMLLSEPQYLSTLFWRPGLVTNNQGEAEFSFMTGDITGDFRIVVQGLSKDDMIWGESRFTVK